MDHTLHPAAPIHTASQKKLDSNRHAFEDVDRVIYYFQRLKEVIEREGITPGDIWSMDETGLRIGISKDQFIVIKRKRAHLFSMPENRESATAIEVISADGRHIPAFLIPTGQFICHSGTAFENSTMIHLLLYQAAAILTTNCPYNGFITSIVIRLQLAVNGC
jgi:hypothetical protein